MSVSMAEVVRLHSQIGRDEKGQYCTYCNHRYGYAAERTLHRQASDHVAEQLAAAGYGKLEDAWDYGFSACGREFRRQREDPEYPITRVNPHRKLGES